MPPPSPGDLNLRAEQPADLGFAEALFADVHAPRFAPLGLPPQALHSLLQMQLHAQRTGYSQQFPASEAFLVELAGEPVGRLLIERAPHSIHLIDIAVLSSSRNRGIASWLLQQLSAQADAHQQEIHLSVSLGSPALSLYQRHGFFIIENSETDLKMKRFPSTPANGT